MCVLASGSLSAVLDKAYSAVTAFHSPQAFCQATSFAREIAFLGNLPRSGAKQISEETCC